MSIRSYAPCKRLKEASSWQYKGGHVVCVVDYEDALSAIDEAIQLVKSTHTPNRVVRNIIKERDACISHYRALAISGHPEMTEEQIDDFEWWGE